MFSVSSPGFPEFLTNMVKNRGNERTRRRSYHRCTRKRRCRKLLFPVKFMCSRDISFAWSIYFPGFSSLKSLKTIVQRRWWQRHAVSSCLVTVADVLHCERVGCDSRILAEWRMEGRAYWQMAGSFMILEVLDMDVNSDTQRFDEILLLILSADS